MEHISAPIARVLARSGLLCQDVRLKTLFPTGHEVREPRRRTYHVSKEDASRDLWIDHDALLDLLWKLRSVQTLCAVHAQRTGDGATRDFLLQTAMVEQDTVGDIEKLLARKAEAELWLENIE